MKFENEEQKLLFSRFFVSLCGSSFLPTVDSSCFSFDQQAILGSLFFYVFLRKGIDIVKFLIRSSGSSVTEEVEVK